MFWTEFTWRGKYIPVLLLPVLLLIGLVWYVQHAILASEEAAEKMGVLTGLFARVNESHLNIIKADDLAGAIALSGQDRNHVKAEIVSLSEEFAQIAEGLAPHLAVVGGDRYARFVEHGELFYRELQGLLSIVDRMEPFSLSWHGERRAIHEIVRECRLVHYKFVSQLAARVRKQERFLGSAEYGKCTFSSWRGGQTVPLDPALEKMLGSLESLHFALHEAAVNADRLIGAGRGDEAKRVMDGVFNDMILLDGRLADIEQYGFDKFQAVQADFRAGKERIHLLRDELLPVLVEWEQRLKNGTLPEVQRELRESFARSRLLVVIAAALVFLLSLAGCLFTARKTITALRVTRESHEAFRTSLERQQQLIDNLEREIEQRKRIEAELHTANQELEAMAVTDGLTGLYNHRFMKQFLHMEHNRAIRHGHDLSVIMIDIDFFKKVNDAYGHGCGDIVLLGIAEILQQRVRSTDMIARFDVDQAVVARYGGEEMAIILPETPLAGAVGLAEDLRRMIESYTFHCEEVTMNITVSIGVAASSKKKDETWSTLLGRADAALYRAKSAGRNRVEYLS
ncbi:MAG: GGDEF domain-containing protein [Thermodesulfobacteriota bacterium]